MSPTLFHLLKICGENFRFPVLSELLVKQGAVTTSRDVAESYEPGVCCIVQRRVRLVRFHNSNYR